MGLPSQLVFRVTLFAFAAFLAACSRGAYAPAPAGGAATQSSAARAASGETTFFAFPDLAAGREPRSPAIFDSQGDLFGSTYAGGGPADGGTIYELVPGPFGLEERVLFRFNPNSAPGTNPGPIAMDAAGNIYGIASNGVFKLRKTGSGYTMQLIYRCFQGNSFNHDPEVTPVQNFNTTDLYVACSSAAVLLTPNSFGNGYTATTLHIFTEGLDGINVNGGFLVDSSMRVYGTTTYSGAFHRGTVFRLGQIAPGIWGEKVLHTFGGPNDGAFPWAGLSIDANGNLYGTTTQGGNGDGGVVYKLVPNSGGTSYGERVIDNPSQPRSVGRPVINAAGDVYFTAVGSFESVFKLTPNPNGHGYTESTLFKTLGPLMDDSLFTDSSGAIYGTTMDGGKGCPADLGCGFIYKIPQ